VKAPLPALVLLLVAVSGTAAATGRAIWTWESASYEMLEHRGAADEAIAFAHAQKIDTLYLYADAFAGRNLIVTEQEAYHRFLRRLHRNGIRAYALLGSAFLHTEAYVLPEQRARALAMFQRVLAYNAAAAPEERFDGINLDIEPHILAAWDTRKMQLLEDYLELGQALMDLKRASGQALEVGPAIPFWLDGITLAWHGRTSSVAEHVLGLYDYAALMDYRDHALGRDGIVSHAVDNLAIARRLHRRLVIGVDVTPGEPQKVSFDHLLEADLERELGLAEAEFRDDAAFAGFAIHHFRGYQAWLARGRRPD
jgi:tetratricopeptide (TPR) repeat protein